MTVSELIAKLSELPGDAEVITGMVDPKMYNDLPGRPVLDVEYKQAVKTFDGCYWNVSRPGEWITKKRVCNLVLGGPHGKLAFGVA